MISFTCVFEYSSLSLILSFNSVVSAILPELYTNGSTYFSIPVLSIIVPPITASTIPTTTYASAIFQLKILASKITDARSTRGDDIRNEKVTPTGSPALVKPMNIGIEEHEQNGVIVPNKAPIILAPVP